jgi:hypothetical protein
MVEMTLQQPGKPCAASLLGNSWTIWDIFLGIERYHRSMKNVVKLQNYSSPSELESVIAEFVSYADVYFGREKEMLKKRE